MKSGVTPVAACSSSVNCEWVVLAGWMISDLASPTFARSEKSFTSLIKRLARLAAALDAEADDGAVEAVLVVAPRQLVRRVVRQARIETQLDGGVPGQELRDAQRVLAVALHPQRQRLQPLQEEEAS